MEATRQTVTAGDDAAIKAAPNHHGIDTAKDLTFGSIAGILGKIVEYPFDTVKVRLQSQPDSQPLRYQGPIDCLKQSFQHEGLRGLYRGVSAPLVGAAAETSSLFFSYGIAKDLLQSKVYGSSSALPLPALVFAGAASGAFTSLVLTPIELVKCQMQVSARSASDQTARRASSIIRSIYTRHGVIGFWHGQLGTLIRETGGSAAWFGSYEAVLLLFKKYRHPQPLSAAPSPPPIHQQLIAGAIAGMSYNFIFFPADTIKSCMQTEEVPLDRGSRRTFGAVSRALWQQHGLSNCPTRLPALHLETKKGGPNHGKWFYKCQKPQHEQCKFFLWEQDAKAREEDAMPVHNPRPEAATINYPKLREMPTDVRSKPVPSTANNLGNSPVNNQRSPVNNQRKGATSPTFDDNDNGPDDDWSLSGDEEAQIMFEASHHQTGSPRRRIPQPETPRKATKIVSFGSPGKQSNPPSSMIQKTNGTTRALIDFVTGVPKTPSRNINTPGGITGTPSRNTNAPGGISGQLLSPPATTPTPTRFRDINVGFGGADSTLAEEILKAVETTGRLNDGAKNEVRNICNRHALRTQGIEKGRDISRLAIKAKETKIAELEFKIGLLEAEHQKDKQIINELKEMLKGLNVRTIEEDVGSVEV
ncbi:MAG: hypothetical protein M1823_002667 [Watsoniomyces obsoletus]|nr:MAG: hypothetical protein M1823_002667 [Watsoniomyces obsoletus]